MSKSRLIHLHGDDTCPETIEPPRAKRPDQESELAIGYVENAAQAVEVAELLMNAEKELL